MYARTLEKNDKKQTLTFAVSGMLWNRSLVMIDLETKSLWSHILGESMRGKLKGTELEVIPSLMTDWKTWRTRHPETTVVTLSRTARQFENSIYRNPSQYVIGMTRGDSARAWPFDQLIKQPLSNETFAKKEIVVIFAPKSSTAFVYYRKLKDGKILTFSQKAGTLIDDQTKSIWDATTGLATAGPLKGKSLKLVPAIVSFKRTWKAFHSDSSYFEAKKPAVAK